MILPSPKVNEAINKATDNLEFRDILRRKFYKRELLNEAETALAACYIQLSTMQPGIEKEELALHRLNLETHIEFLNREYFRVTNEVDALMPLVSINTRKALNRLELDFNNNTL